MPTLPGHFDTALRSAIADRGLSLARLHHRLRERGLAVSVASLSNWQSGRCRPEPDKSLAALSALEQILGVPDNGLTGLLGPRRPRGRWLRRGDGVARALERVLADIAPREPELRWRTVHERVEMRPDRTEGATRTEIVFEATADGVDRHIALHHHESGAVPELSPVSHCRVGRTKVDRDDAIYAVEFLFDHPLRRGETYVLEYEFAPVPGPAATNHQRWFRYPARDFVLRVDFDRGAVPATCHQVWSPESGGPARDVRRLWPSQWQTVHVAEQNVVPGGHGIRWEW
jgi:hypothetical protein